MTSTIYLSIGIGQPYTTEELMNMLRSKGLSPAMTDRAFTNRHWHFVWALADNGHTDHAVLSECGTGRVLYLAHDHKTVICRSYDSFRHAMDSLPSMRRGFAMASAAMRANADKFTHEQKAQGPA